MILTWASPFKLLNGEFNFFRVDTSISQENTYMQRL